MKKSDEWNTQDKLDKKLDELIEQLKIKPGELGIYQAAKLLDVSPSGPFYMKLRDWRERRVAEIDKPLLEVSPMAKVKIEGLLHEFTTSVTKAYLDEIRAVSGDLDRAANLRVADKDQRLEAEKHQSQEIIELWIKSDAEVASLHERITDLEKKLAAALREIDQLTGRLMERQEQSKANRDRENVAGAKPVQAIAAERASDLDQPDERGAHASKAFVAGLLAEVSSADNNAELRIRGPKGSAQSSIKEDDGHPAHQADLSPVNNDNANKAEVDDDGND